MGLERNPFRDLLGRDAGFTKHLDRLGTPLDDEASYIRARSAVAHRNFENMGFLVEEDDDYRGENKGEQLFTISTDGKPFSLYLSQHTSMIEFRRNALLPFTKEPMEALAFGVIPRLLLGGSADIVDEMRESACVELAFGESQHRETYNLANRFHEEEYMKDLENAEVAYYGVDSRKRNLRYNLHIARVDSCFLVEPTMRLEIPKRFPWSANMLSWFFANQEGDPTNQRREFSYWEKLSNTIQEIQHMVTS